MHLLRGALACAAVALLMALAATPSAHAQAAICERVKPPPSHCYGEDGPETPPTEPHPKAPAPTDLHMTGRTHNSISLAWTDLASDEQAYWIEYVNNDGYWRTIPGGHLGPSAGTGGRMTVTHTDLEAGRNYRYRVRVLNGNTSFSPTIDASTLPVIEVSVSFPQLNSLYVHWNPIDGATGYVVEYREAGIGAQFTPIATLGPEARSHWATGLTAGTEYEFRVTALGVPADAYVPIAGSGTTVVPKPQTETVWLHPTDQLFEYEGGMGNLIHRSARILSVTNISQDDGGELRDRRGLHTVNLRYRGPGWTDASTPELGYQQLTSAFNGLPARASEWKLRVSPVSTLFLFDCAAFADPPGPGCTPTARIGLKVTYQ